MNNDLAIIGASYLQLPLIQKAKQMGYTTHVFAWAANDVGETEADHFYPISIVETDRILAQCREIGICGICSIASDLAAITVNKVANALGLPSNPIETATIATNKYEMRKTFQSAGLPTPRFMKVGLGDDLSAAESMQLPIIVKPTDRSGSRGIYKLNTLSELPLCVAEAAAQSFEKKVIVEEYIEGKEYSAECISFEGRHRMLAVTKKYTTGAPHFIEIGHMEPSGLDDETVACVKAHVFKALDALHVTSGASHSEFMVTPNGAVRLIEIGARMGGDCIGSDLVRLTTGFDFVKMTIQAALGEQPDTVPGPHIKAAIVRYVMHEADYRRYLWVRKNHTSDLVRASDMHTEGEKAVTDSSTRYGFYIVAGESTEKLCELVQLPQNP